MIRRLRALLAGQRWRLEPVYTVECDPCASHRGRDHRCPDHRVCECTDPCCRKAIIIEYVDRPPMPKVPTYIAFCCREYIAPYGFYGLRCVHCGQFPTYLREDTPEAAAKAPRTRERIVVRSTT